MDRYEAIGVVRSFIDKLAPEHKEALSSLLPELAESEDEKIRKEIVTFLKKGTPYYCPDSVIRQKWATWLEKQKEQQPNIEICPHSIKSKSYLETGYPIEQKPAEWSEEDKERYEKVLYLIEHFDNLANEPTFAGPKFTHPYTKEIVWLKSLRLRLFWTPSEEQLSQLQFALNLLEEKCESVPNVLWNLYEDLKKLH